MGHNTDADLIGTLALTINASANAMGHRHWSSRNPGLWPMAKNNRWPKTAKDQKQPMAVHGSKWQSILPNSQYQWRPIELLVADVLR
jgi:hypothetical protein